MLTVALGRIDHFCRPAGLPAAPMIHEKDAGRVHSDQDLGQAHSMQDDAVVVEDAQSHLRPKP